MKFPPLLKAQEPKPVLTISNSKIILPLIYVLVVVCKSSPDHFQFEEHKRSNLSIIKFLAVQLYFF